MLGQVLQAHPFALRGGILLHAHQVLKRRPLHLGPPPGQAPVSVLLDVVGCRVQVPAIAVARHLAAQVLDARDEVEQGDGSGDQPVGTENGEDIRMAFFDLPDGAGQPWWIAAPPLFVVGIAAHAVAELADHAPTSLCCPGAEHAELGFWILILFVFSGDTSIKDGTHLLPPWLR